MEITNLSQLDPNGTYTYADYLLWKFKERVELFKGKIFAMSPAPRTNHQQISGRLHGILFSYFEKRACQLFSAPFDVRLPNAQGEVVTVVQPDLCVICDLSKLDERGCQGAPDLVIEILSPGNIKKEMKNKFELYQEAGVQEYWVVYPAEKCVFVYVLENGRFMHREVVFEDSELVSSVFPEVKIDMQRVFKI
ncbi:Uma2 family endonuclease [Capnocytophaga sp.]|uniref:Uma2 family endonuclease n=1 Tax=Capnocytophaga sp. TaxID=44737 RepID=UPI0026DC4622|nr:Uma2 family endonuclease [Capnocytophaga sp.]MDO5105541.1 Uma2 family endonuclease [Capnocytophaga sp.]